MQLAQSQERLLGLSQGVSEEELARMQLVMTDVFAAVAKSASAEDARARVRAVLTLEALATLKAPESRRELLVQQLANDWSRYLLQYKPAASLSRIRVPILALNGALDRQVSADENLAGIKAALAHNADVTLRKLEGLNHLVPDGAHRGHRRVRGYRGDDLSGRAQYRYRVNRGPVQTKRGERSLGVGCSARARPRARAPVGRPSTERPNVKGDAGPTVPQLEPNALLAQGNRRL
jgi:hypothetical protein